MIRAPRGLSMLIKLPRCSMKSICLQTRVIDSATESVAASYGFVAIVPRDFKRTY